MGRPPPAPLPGEGSVLSPGSARGVPELGRAGDRAALTGAAGTGTWPLSPGCPRTLGTPDALVGAALEGGGEAGGELPRASVSPCCN